MMGGRVVRRRLVARSAHAVALGPQARGVRVVAVGARNAARVHAALQERAVLVVLVEDLPVGLVEPLVEEGHAVRLREGLAGTPVLADLRAPRVAPPAALDLRARVARSGEPRDRSSSVEPPGARSRGEPRVEALRRVASRALAAGPGDVPGAGSVAGLAGDVVAKRSLSVSYFFRTPVEWHLAHMWFQFCAGPVQCRTSRKSTLSFG